MRPPPAQHAKEPSGAPPLYPPLIRMPPPPVPTEREKELLKIKRELHAFWRNSCYYLDS